MADTTDKSASLKDLPPPSFSLLVATFASQAMVALGRVPNPVDGKTSITPELAQHAIDMLVMLETKTKGNLTADEARLLEGAMHQLRLAFLEAKK